MAVEKFSKQKRYDHEHVEFLPYGKKNPAKNFKPKHAKPFRKRHITALAVFVFIFGFCVFGVSVLLVRNAYQRSQSSKTDFARTSKITFNSSLGYRFNFDLSLYDASGSVKNADGSMTTYSSDELLTPRAYYQAQLTPKFDSLGRSIRYDSSYMTVTLYKDTAATDDLPSLANKYQDASTDKFDVAQASEEELTINGQTFLKRTYTNVPIFEGSDTDATTQTILYVANCYGHPLVIKIEGINETFTPVGAYEEIISSTVLENTSAHVLGASYFNPRVVAGWLDPVKSGLRNFIGENETTQQKQARTIATYTPAVVKLYHVVCGELVVNTTSLGYDCLTTTGSGFFVSSDGYLATSGHVVSVSAKDVIVGTAQDDPTTLSSILKLLGYSTAQINQIIDNVNNDPNVFQSILQQIYNLPDDTIYFNGQQDHYVVALGNKSPEFINENDKPNFGVKETDYVKKASLIKADYNSADLVSNTFTGSDVALLKVDGMNYPVVQLGDVNLLAQGEPVTVIGYPAASDNELTDNNSVQSTAATGVISAIRNSNDGQHKIIQSDAPISGGDSGGPAFDEDSRVFGIATYTYVPGDGSETISYMRDVNDLLALAKIQNIKFNTKSSTQSLWESGLNDYYSAHYTSAIDKFEEVKQQYPAHSLADEYIQSAQTHINNGEESTQSSALIYGLVLGMFISLVGAGITIFVIVRHNAMHQHYKAAKAKQHTPGYNHS